MNPNTPIPHGTPEWHAARRGKITASMAPAILCPGTPGVHGNPLTAWMELTGRGEHEDLEDDEAALFGRESENFHARLLGRHAKVDWAVLQPGFLLDEDLDWLGASPDGIGSRNGLTVGGEFKAPTDYEVRRLATHSLLPGYMVQGVVQMRVWRLDAVIVSVFGIPKPSWQELLRASDLERQVLDGLSEFREQYVLTDTPPPLEAEWLDEKTLRAFKRLTPVRAGAAVSWDEGHPGTQAAMLFERAKRELGKWEAEKKLREAELLHLCGDSATIVLPDGTGYRRTERTRPMPPQPARIDQWTELRFSKRIGQDDE